MKTTTATFNAMAGQQGTDDVLVHQQWLQEHLSDPGVRVIEVDVSAAAYQDWHIDGAVLWNVYSQLKDPQYRPAAAADVERLIASTGIGPDSTVVFYGYAPALAFWLLKLHGHRDVRILDCSRETWRAGGRPWTATTVQTAPGGFVAGPEDEHIRASIPDVRAAIGKPGTTLVDVRSQAEYAGERF